MDEGARCCVADVGGVMLGITVGAADVCEVFVEAELLAEFEKFRVPFPLTVRKHISYGDLKGLQRLGRYMHGMHTGKTL